MRKSPDRMDALVWVVTDLMLTREACAEPKVWEGGVGIWKAKKVKKRG